MRAVLIDCDAEHVVPFISQTNGHYHITVTLSQATLATPYLIFQNRQGTVAARIPLTKGALRSIPLEELHYLHCPAADAS